MDEALQTLVARIQQMSVPDSLKDLQAYLVTQEEVLVKHMCQGTQLDDLLPMLDPLQHTLGMLFILCDVPARRPQVAGAPTRAAPRPQELQGLRRAAEQSPGGHAVPWAVPEAAAGVRPGASAAGARAMCARRARSRRSPPARATPRPAARAVLAVCAKFTTAAISNKTPVAAVRPLHAAALALQPTPAHFTPVHADFMRVCLLSKCYAAAQPLLEQELLQVDKEATHVTPRDLLLYHYYAGMVQVGMKRFKSAVEYFTLCYSAPTAVLNAIMVEAYKKGLLCALIETGEPMRTPKYTAACVLRHAKSLAPYVEYAEAFGKRSVAGLRAALEKHTAAFERDHNLGLAKQCAGALIKRNIHRLTTTYLTLSLDAIADSAELPGPADAERYVSGMVASGEICALIDASAGMVRFTERREKYDTAEAAAALERCIDDAVALSRKLFGINAQLASDTQYVMRVSNQERAPRWEEDAMLTK